MWVETFVCCYVGLACLACGNHRFAALPLREGRIVGGRRARLTGAASLALGMVAAIRGAGVAQGIVATALAASVAGMLLVLMLSIRPTTALAITVPLLRPGAASRRTSS